ncbi:hypothetical protein M3Y98_00315300 [Aphelenchoides besseyi]|nr:hypothetical protein M3Y98_00315300 [Aphelenchoides besseyi]
METSTTLPFEFTTTRVQVDQQTMSHTTARSVFRFPSTTTSLQTTTITEVDGESGIRTVDSDTSTIRANVFSSPHIDGMPFPFGTTGIGRRMRVSVPFNWTTSSIPFTQSTTMIPSSNREFMPDQMPSFHHRVSEKRAELTERLITQPSTTTTNIRDHSWTLQRIAANHPANSTIIHHRLTTTVPTVRSFSRNNEFIRKETRECADSHVHCCYWALAGECDINLYWMRINCAKTCGTCNCSLREAEHCVSTGIHCTIPTTSTTTTTTTTTTQAPTTTTLLTTTTSSPPSTTLPSGRFTSRPRNLPRWKTHPLPAAPPAFNPQDNSKEVIKTRPTNGYESVVDNTKGPKFVHRPGIEEPYTTVESTVATTLSTSTLMTSTVPTSTPSSCYNYHRLCQFWADLSECTKNPFWMRPHCQRACNSCGETLQDVYAPKARPNCSNQNNLCPFWAYIDHGDGLDSFTNFHFAQAAVKILDNMGFSAATTDSLEILTAMMRRYFDDLCYRVSLFTQNAGRCITTMSDLNSAFKAQNVSISELHDYIQQVRNLPSSSAIPLYPIEKFIDKECERKFLFADPFDDNIPTVEEVEQIHGKRKSIFESSFVEDGENMEVDQKENNETANETSEAMEIVKIVQVNNNTLWETSEIRKLPNFINMNAADLGFDMNLYDQKQQKAETRKENKSEAVHARVKVEKSFDSPHKSSDSIIKEKSLNMLVEKIKKIKHKKRDKDRDSEKSKSKHRKKHREQFPIEAPILTAADEIPPLSDTYTPSVCIEPQMEAPKSVDLPKISFKPIRTPPQPIETAVPIQVQSPQLTTFSPPPLLDQLLPNELPANSTPVNSTPIEASQNNVKDSVETEPKKEKHKKNKDKKKEKKKDKKRDKERDPEKSKSKHRKKHREQFPIEAPILTAVDEIPPLSDTYTPSVCIEPQMEAPKSVDLPKISFKPIRTPPRPIETAVPIQVQSPQLTTFSPPPLLDQLLPNELPANSTPVNSTPIEAPQNNVKDSVETEPKKEKHKKNKDKKKEKKKDKKRDKERDPEKSKSKHRKKHPVDKTEPAALKTPKIEELSTMVEDKKEPSPMEIAESSVMDEDVWVCPICSVAYVDGAADMVGCDLCDKWYHWHCVGMLKPPAENEPWYCPECSAANCKKSKTKRKNTMTPQIRHISFNALQDCFAVATESGVRVFNSRPLVEMNNLKTEVVGSIKLVAILDRTNFIAMVSGDPRPKFSNKSVMIWDDLKQKFVMELIVSSPVLNVLVSSTRIVVVQRHHVHVFSMDTFELAAHDETGINPQGLCALSPSPKSEYLVFPSFKPGSIQVLNLRNASQYRSSAPVTIYAHETEIAKIAIDNQATKIATGSIKGTVIRIFDTQTKALLFELRRGTHLAQLFCNKPDERLSNTKKIIDHVRFGKNERRSIFQFTMPKHEQIAECAFLPEDNTNPKQDLIAVTKDGYYYHFSEWNAKPQGYELIFNLAIDQEFWKKSLKDRE